MAYLDICGSGESAPKNTGFKDQCLETKLEIPVLSNGYKFETIADFRERDVWLEAIRTKKLVPLFPVYELADASTEDTVFESGNFRKTTAKGVEVITYENYISICAYEALKSYENSGEFGELFEFNEGTDYLGIATADGEVRGRKIKSLRVRRIRATNEKIPYVSVEITYTDRDEIMDAVVVKSDLRATDLVGIFDVSLEKMATTSTSIKFRAVSGCAGNALITSFSASNFVVKNSTGTVVTPTGFVAPDSDGVYEITGTGFANGFTVNLDGVVTVGGTFYEAQEKLVVSV